MKDILVSAAIKFLTEFSARELRKNFWKIGIQCSFKTKEEGNKKEETKPKQ